MQPVELMTDTAGYSDQVFGLFQLLGYQFSPRLADIGSARFWRITRDADYGQLSGLARHQINTDLIATHWDDLLRVAGSLATGTVRASELLRVLQGGGRPTPLGRPVAELGRITKTLYLLAYLDDETYRRRILTQLNRTESRHALARAVFHGQRGQLRRSAPSASSSTPSSCGTLATRRRPRPPAPRRSRRPRRRRTTALGTAARVDQWGPRQRDTPAPEEHGGSEGDKQDEQQQPNDPR